MTASRLSKMLSRRLMVSWREQRTRYDIEALQANIERVGLVIRVRWALVAALAIYSVLGGWVYTLEIPVSELWANMQVPAAALLFVLAYNTYYQMTYRRLGNIAVLNHAQLMFDVMVVAVLVHYSGGIHSWFWAMQALFILEAAFILPRAWHSFIIAVFAALALGVVVWGEYLGWMPHVTMPFITDPLHENLTFVAVRYFWQLTVLFGTATVASLVTSALRKREEELSAASILDDKTGLYDRHYFTRALSREMLRAERDDRAFAVILADIDDFERFNRLFGIEKGDRLLREVAHAMSRAVVSYAGAGVREANIISRYGGEEFAIVLTENASGVPPQERDVAAVAEAVRVAAAAARVSDAGVTISLGAARYPDDAMTTEALLDSADEALTAASAMGGNRVVVASNAPTTHDYEMSADE